MDKINKLWPVILAVAIVAIVLLVYQFLKIRLEAPDFAGIEDVQKRQAVFFDYFGHSTQKINAAIMRDREKLEKLAANPADLGTKEGWLKALGSHYGVNGEVTPAFFSELLRRMDVLPPALVLTQAALESEWGTSRFATEGNNFFGEKCFDKGCGIAPRDLPPGQTFEMATFDTPFDSTNKYILDINTDPAYAKLRSIRAQLRKNGRPITGRALAEGLESNSENDAAFIRKVKAMIADYKLDETYGLLPPER